MANLETVASPGIVALTMLSVCVLGIGFMMRFFVAMTLEAREEHATHPLRDPRVHCKEDIACAAAPSRKPTANSAAYVAMGVVRITTALASNAGRRNSDISSGRLHVVTLGRTSPELDFPVEHRYRSGWSRADRRTRTCETLFSSQQQLPFFWFQSRMWSSVIAFAEVKPMEAESIIMLIVSAGLMVYLLYALLRPERF
jgi:K+-transporting ATPase KdpF subunit